MFHRGEIYVRNFVFGVEDSLVSTAGLLSGIAVAGMARADIVVTGIVLVFVEAFSMGAGSFLSEWSAEEYRAAGRHVAFRRSLIGGAVMFISYLVAGFVPLVPYFFAERALAFPISVGAALAALFGLGLTIGRMVHQGLLARGMRALLVGGAAVVLGVLVGGLLR